MVKLVRVTVAKAPSPNWVLWGPDLVNVVWQLGDSQNQFALKKGMEAPSSTPPHPLGPPTPYSLSLAF